MPLTARDYVPTIPVPLANFPRAEWIVGSARYLTNDGLGFFQECERIAGMVKARILHKTAYIITEPCAIADVLVNSPNCFVKPYVLRRLRVLFGDGLLTSNGDHWKRNRHLVQPAFSAEPMPEFLKFVGYNTEDMVASWRDGEVRDLYPDFVDLCMRNITIMMFGVYDEVLGNVTRALAAISHELVRAVFSIKPPRPFFFPRNLKRALNYQLGALDGYLGRLIEERKQQPPRGDFLGLLMASGVDYQTIRDESVTMLLAGHETSAAAVVWCLYLLARHPQYAEALAGELAAHLGGKAPSYEDLERLPLLRGTIDETMRLYPPTHRIGRSVKTPVMVGGHMLRAGVDILLPQWAVHRSPRWYDRPEEFIPERWTPEFKHSLPKFTYFPFSGGPRTCVGSHLSWSEVAAIIGLLVQRYRLTLADPRPLKPVEGLTLLPAGSRLEMRIQTRVARSQTEQQRA